MKRLIKKVDLVFFCDDANGEWGLAHKETFEENNGNGFNAFWNGIGIFHDVFEHSHEKTHKYFQGDYSMNIGGEMTAMGALWYYFDELGINNRLKYGYVSPSQSMRETTSMEVKEAIQDGYCQFGYTLESNVPYQRPTDNGELEYQISEYWKQVKNCHYDKRNITENYKCENEIESSKAYKESVTFRKIADLHRYGYRMAEKLVPLNSENRETLYNFLDFWNEFCKNNKAEFMAGTFNGLEVKLYKDSEGVISWKATFIGNGNIKNLTLRENQTWDISDDIYTLMDDFSYN